MRTEFTDEQITRGRDMLESPEDFPVLLARMTLAGPVVTALLINLGVVT